MNIDSKTLFPANILIVDDTLENVRLLSTLLTKHGYKVRGVTNGEMALKAVRKVPPQLILLDVKMPDIDGYEVCRRLKQIPVISEIPVIFLSALDDVEEKVKAFEVGGIDYITKPFQLQEVLIRVENQLKIQSTRTKIKELNEELEERVKQRTAQLEKEIVRHKETQEQLRRMAFYDSLTGLPNRAFFLELLQRAIQRNKRQPDYLFSVLFLDCDRFKLINDSLGHFMGDQVLKEMALRLKLCLRPGDTIARLGGDEFIILLEELKNIHDPELVASRLNQELKIPFYLNEREMFLGASIGIVLDTKHYQSPEMILRDADTAMYWAKKSGKDCYQVFKPEMHSQAQEALQFETDLRLALKREEFSLYYQPIICLKTGLIKSFEALLRWNRPTKGFISPADFIPVAEETGLIIPLGMWVLREACRQLRTWQQQNSALKDLTISVNLSVKQFSQRKLIQQIDKILAETRLESKYLKLEITESAIMDNSDSLTSILEQLRNRKIQLSIDDFGTGYSSLSYLHRFPVDYLKIDRSFVQQMENKSEENIRIVDTIIDLAHHLKIQVIAEGIETEEQVTLLTNLGCEYGQGYYLSRPLDSESATKFLKSYHN